MFPIALDSHWSLVVAYYPGIVGSKNIPPSLGVSDIVPVLVHLDSLTYHNGVDICDNLRLFFKFQWSQKKGNSFGFKFTKTNYPLIVPDGMLLFVASNFIIIHWANLNLYFYVSISLVPQQKNGYDYGWFVSRYALAIRKMNVDFFPHQRI